jgi:HEPN domain-containing protein
MNTVLNRLLIIIFIVSWVSVTGCSTSDEKQTVDSEKLTESAVQTEDVKPSDAGQATSEIEKATESVPEVKDEPVVEVIPNESSQDEKLTVEPIATPEAAVEKDIKPPAEEQDTAPGEGEKKAESGPAETEAKLAAVTQAPTSTGPDHFVITADKKDQSHPFFGKGHAMGFIVNNEQGKEIVMERGKTYRIDVATDPMHDVYISLKEIGWGSSPYSKGIEGQFTYKGTITIKPDNDTPDLLFYSCRNHPYMGGKIHIVNPGQTVELAKKQTAATTSVAAAAEKQISKADVNQKIMFADMLLKSKSSQTVLNSNISDAIKLQDKAKADLKSARENLKAGKNADAYKQAENAIVLLKKSTKLVPNESALEHMKDRYKELLASIKDFEVSHKESYQRILKKQGKDAVTDYDKNEVEKLKTSAEQSAKKGDYLKANQNLEKAQRMITVALHKMLNNQTIVYDLNFETAEEEYEYELKRFAGYEELIPIAVEQKKPAAGAKKLMESFLKKGQDLRDRAVKNAKAGDYPTAIAMLQDATKDVRRALRMIGVAQ